MGALTCGEAAESIREELCARRAAFENELTQRLERAKAEGDLPADTNCADLARLVMTITQGMSVQAASGASPHGPAQGRRDGAEGLARLRNRPRPPHVCRRAYALARIVETE